MMKEDATLFYQNVRGLRTKHEDIYMGFITNDYDIIALTETWLGEQHQNVDFFPNTYTVYRADRAYRELAMTMGGGSLIAVKSCISSFGRVDLEIIPEVVWVEMPRVGRRNLLIGNHYFAPSTEPSYMGSYMDSLASLIDPRQYDIIIVGDFNASSVLWERRLFLPNIHFYSKTRAKFLFDFADSMSLDFVDSNSTGGYDNGARLDLIITNSSIQTCPALGLVPVDKFHPPFVATIKELKSLQQSSEVPKYNYKKADFPSLFNDVKNAAWCNVLLSRSLDESVKDFQGVVVDAIRRNVPFSKRRSPRYPVWFSHQLVTLIKRKKAAHRRYRRSGLQTDYEDFSYLRKEVKRFIQRDKINNARGCEGDLMSKPENFWKYISNHTSTRKAVAPLVEGRCIEDPQLLCSLFGRQFQSVYQDCRADYSGRGCSSENDSGCRPQCDLIQCAELDVPFVSSDCVLWAINQLNPRCATGPDGVPSFIIRGIGPIISPILAALCNWSLSAGVFPSIWKEANVTPVPKPGLPNISNFRPISVLNSFSKLIERIVYRHMYQHVHHLITGSQHGFMRCRSTVSNIGSFLSTVGAAVENQGQVDTVYFDFEKAFDKMPHNCLLLKLRNYGFSERLVRWISSYLEDRRFSVQYAGARSMEKFCASSGVPQGSILGPLFFLLFINDISQVITVNFELFADDLKIYRQIGSVGDHVELQRNIDAVSDWAQENQLPLNIKKSMVVSFSRKTNVSIFPYRLCSQVIRKEQVVRDLGVLLDSKLYMTGHVESIISKARRNLGLLKWVCRPFQSIRTCTVLFKALVRCHLEYATVTWNRARLNTSNSIEVVQNMFLSWLRTKFEELQHFSTGEIRSLLGLPSLSSRRDYFDLLYYHQRIHGRRPKPGNIDLRVPQREIRGFCPLVISHRQNAVPEDRCGALAAQLWNDIDFLEFDEKLFKRSLKIQLCMS